MSGIEAKRGLITSLCSSVRQGDISPTSPVGQYLSHADFPGSAVLQDEKKLAQIQEGAVAIPATAIAVATGGAAAPVLAVAAEGAGLGAGAAFLVGGAGAGVVGGGGYRLSASSLRGQPLDQIAKDTFDPKAVVADAALGAAAAGLGASLVRALPPAPLSSAGESFATRAASEAARAASEASAAAESLRIRVIARPVTKLAACEASAVPDTLRATPVPGAVRLSGQRAPVPVDVVGERATLSTPLLGAGDSPVLTARSRGASPFSLSAAGETTPATLRSPSIGAIPEPPPTLRSIPVSGPVAVTGQKPPLPVTIVGEAP